MALSLRNGLCVSSASYGKGLLDMKEVVFNSSAVLVCKKEFKGSQVVLRQQRWSPRARHPIIHVSFLLSLFYFYGNYVMLLLGF